MATLSIEEIDVPDRLKAIVADCKNPALEGSHYRLSFTMNPRIPLLAIRALSAGELAQKRLFMGEIGPST